MSIRYFGKLIEVENLKDHILKNSTVVVDASNFFYRLYQKSGLEYVFGCDCDKYANYIREYLSMFKRANVKCFFIFTGGDQNLAKRLATVNENEMRVNFDINESYKDIVLPIFMEDVYKEVLDEMGFDYTICEYESKKECIALAQKLKCPVISYDIEFCFSGLLYIMQSTLKFDEQNNRIECGIFLLDEFLKNHNLTEEKLTLFTVLTDETNFPNNYFENVIRALGIPIQYYKRNQAILAWLAKTTRTDALSLIFRYMKKEDESKFLKVEKQHRELIRRQETPGIPAQYLENGNKIEVNEKDQFWFEKGVASKHIPSQLVNPARTGIIVGTTAIADYTQDDAKLLSMEIIKYTYNLLTNFEKEQCILYIKRQEIPVLLKNSTSKPDYDGINSPFENGWKQLKGELFEHFLKKNLEGFYSEAVGNLHEEFEDLKMLMIALVYFPNKTSRRRRNVVCSVLLSYVAVSVVNKAKKNKILNEDKFKAKTVLEKYFDVGAMEKRRIFDVKILHSLVEFQHCLQSLNYLNVLCGKLYKPTTYNKTYNATFVYKVLYTIETEFKGDCMDFLTQTLNTAPTLLSYIQNLMHIFDTVGAKFVMTSFGECYLSEQRGRGRRRHNRF